MVVAPCAAFKEQIFNDNDPSTSETCSSLYSSTLIILDWDDTLLCTSYLQQLKDRTALGEEEDRLQSIEGHAYSLVDLALNLGHTFIITNATEDWIESSARCFMPRLLPLLEQVNIVSARSLQEHVYPGNQRQWKIQTFLDLGHHFQLGTITNLVSIGDSSFEMDAAKTLGASFGCRFVKTVKLRSQPSAMVLVKELGLLVNKFSSIVKKRNNLDVKLEWKAK